MPEKTSMEPMNEAVSDEVTEVFVKWPLLTLSFPLTKKTLISSSLLHLTDSIAPSSFKVALVFVVGLTLDSRRQASNVKSMMPCPSVADSINRSALQPDKMSAVETDKIQLTVFFIFWKRGCILFTLSIAGLIVLNYKFKKYLIYIPQITPENIET